MRERLFWTVLALSFVGVFIEARALHLDILGEYWQGYIPLVYAGFAFVAGLLLLTLSHWSRVAGSVVFGLGILVGIVGVYNHTEGELDKLATLFTTNQPLEVWADEDDEYGEEHVEDGGYGSAMGYDEDTKQPEEEEHEDIPYIAPLSITGLSLIGLIFAWPDRRKPTETKSEAAAEATAR